MICKQRLQENPAVVTTFWRDGHKHATATSCHRGGCLYAGFVTLKNLQTTQIVTVESTACWDYQVGDANAYLSSLWDKHLGGN